jgi:hypothetical protein
MSILYFIHHLHNLYHHKWVGASAVEQHVTQEHTPNKKLKYAIICKTIISHVYIHHCSSLTLFHVPPAGRPLFVRVRPVPKKNDGQCSEIKDDMESTNEEVIGPAGTFFWVFFGFRRTLNTFVICIKCVTPQTQY